MKIIQPYIEVDPFSPPVLLRYIERKGRVSYKSEDKITADSAEKFIRALIKQGRESVLEHGSIGAKIVCDRGISHELVRHRIGMAITQESTRYVSYAKQKKESPRPGENPDGEITFVEPYHLLTLYSGDPYYEWEDACYRAEQTYLSMVKDWGTSPQWARSVLPHSTKTEVEITANIREWRHIFRLRCQHDAHPQFQQVAIPLLLFLQDMVPVLFEDIPYNEEFPNEHYATVSLRSQA